MRSVHPHAIVRSRAASVHASTVLRPLRDPAVQPPPPPPSPPAPLPMHITVLRLRLHTAAVGARSGRLLRFAGSVIARCVGNVVVVRSNSVEVRKHEAVVIGWRRRGPLGREGAGALRPALVHHLHRRTVQKRVKPQPTGSSNGLRHARMHQHPHGTYRYGLPIRLVHRKGKAHAWGCSRTPEPTFTLLAHEFGPMAATGATPTHAPYRTQGTNRSPRKKAPW